jgi:hypothetical protein
VIAEAPLIHSVWGKQTPPSGQPLPRNVKVPGQASLLNDVASEMIFPLLPNFLLTVLLGNRFYLGVIEGAAGAAHLPPPDAGADLAAAGRARAGPGHLRAFRRREVGRGRPDLLPGGGEARGLILSAALFCGASTPLSSPRSTAAKLSPGAPAHTPEPPH